MFHEPGRSLARRASSLIGLALVIGGLAAVGCSSNDNGSGNGTTTDGGAKPDGASSGGEGGAALGDAGACASDRLKTNLPPLFNGNSVDMDDCPILTFTAKYAEPDAMIFKAIIYVESRFQYDAVGCTSNTGCCPASNWTDAECACLGSMQTGPQCGGSSTLGLLPNGHPDLDTDPSSPDWASSCFNPTVNIELGIAGIAGNRQQEKTKFPGCTEDQYTMMAIGDYNSYGSTKSCTVYNTDYDNAVLDAYKQYATASGWPAHAY